MKKFISVNNAKLYGIFLTLFTAIFFSSIFTLSASKLPGKCAKKPGAGKANTPATTVPADFWKVHDFFQIQFIHS